MAVPETRLKRLVLIGAIVLGVLAAGALAAPHIVYDQFLWKYFWGPITADAGTATLTDCPNTLPDTPTGDIACRNGVVAHSGYTLVNEIGYGLTLIYLILLLTTVLRRADIGTERQFALYFVPFIVGGGMLRVVEDVAGTHPDLIGYPLRYALISPLIYLSMFVIVFVTLLFGLYLERRTGYVGDYRYIIAGGGTVFLLTLTAILVTYGTAVAAWMLPVTIGGAAALLGGYAYLLRYIARGYSRMQHIVQVEGIVVLYGHLLDGVSTAVSLDVLGMAEKHPVPRTLIAYTGTPYAFIAVKLLVITGVLYYMDDELRADDPLFYNLILLGVLAVGMGPGVRNMLRAVFGV